MTKDDDSKAEPVEALLATPDLADALESEQFRRFLDKVPLAILVSDLTTAERIVYANPEFEKLCGQAAGDLVGQAWSDLHGQEAGAKAPRKLGEAVVAASDFVGTFTVTGDERTALVDAYSNIIEDDDGTPCYRLVALVDNGGQEEREALEQRLRDKDVLLLEIQHRVKNNLQMITALMRIEARNAKGRMDTAPFDRLAGRIQSIQHLYALLSDHGKGDEIDLGTYLSTIASSVLGSHAVEGIRLDLKVDAYAVSVNVAMPIGLVVNELLTNALKHAFAGRDGGTITLHSLADAEGCRIVVADDGIGLPAGNEWPQRGKLSALIIQSLRQNAKADIKIESHPGQGTRATISFTRAAAAPSTAS
jgi:PAS domain S-box-containing protein